MANFMIEIEVKTNKVKMIELIECQGGWLFGYHPIYREGIKIEFPKFPETVKVSESETRVATVTLV